MEKLLITNVGDVYVSSTSSSYAIGYLGGFLCYDVGVSVDFFKEWLADPSRVGTGGNYSQVEKHGDIITIAFEYDWFNETPGAPVFELTLTQMNYILDRWQEALEKKPNKIIITKDDSGKIKVEFED
jgi:hypothetical protein